MMSWYQIFQPSRNRNRNIGLIPEELLQHPRPHIFWYASADRDYRPVVFMHPAFQKKRGIDIGQPHLFIYTCLPPSGLYGRYLRKGKTLYKDNKTHISCTEFSPLRLNRELIEYNINKSWAHFGRDPLFGRYPEAHFAHINIQSKTAEPHNCYILYLHMENNNCYDEILSRNYFDFRYLCATREGCGMGGCRRSVITHLYKDNHIQKAIENNCDPSYVITWSDFTDAQFRKESSKWYSKREIIDNYIGEQGNTSSRHYVHQLSR